MELRILGLDPIPGSGNGFGSVSVDVEVSKQKWDTRFEGFKQEGSGFCGGDAWRASKMAKTQVDFSLASTADAAVYSDAHMLRFSSGSKLESSALPYFHNMEAAHVKNSGYYSSGGSMDPSTGGVRLLSGIGGPFTPSQWLELEQQALIYRYVTANEPVPVHLLIPIRKAFESAGFYGINGAALKPTAWGWGPFHLGYSNSTDPEPGRCRRTDGKKWRCSRDAVINQKYCEKHMNRGRHRSRKHVEGQGTVSGATKSSTTKPMPPSSVLPGGGSSNSFDINQHQQIQGKSLQPTTSNPSMNASLNKMIVNRENSGQTLQDAAQLSFMSEGINLNSNGKLSISKHQICSQEPALNGFGAISSESLMDAAASRRSYDPYTQVFNKQGENESRNSLCTFLDDWPVNHSSTDIMSSTTSPANEKAAVSPLRLSQEHEIEIGFGSQVQCPIQAAANWKPISWEGPMGGPLGEALQSSSISNSTDESRKSSALSLLPRGWDGIGSCQVSTTSPTGILQRSALVSLSNSSAGSSPIADNSKTIESGGNFVN